MKLVNWNVYRAPPSDCRREEIVKCIHDHEPQVIFLTETHVNLLPDVPDD